MGLVLVVPVLEELVFRGLIQDYLRRWVPRDWGPVSSANGLTSVLFAAVHSVTHPALWAALTFFPSLVFGFFRERHHSLVTPMVLHVYYNAGYYWLFG